MAGAIVQSAYAVNDAGGSATTIAATLNSVVAGNTLVAHCGFSAGAGTISVSDGTAYSTGDSKRNDTNQDGQVFYLENVGSGTHVITATNTVSQPFRRIRVYEISGLATSSSLDKNVGQGQTAPGTGANGISSSATAATANATDFILGLTQNGSMNDPGTGTTSAGTGYTINGSNRIMAAESKSVAATGAQTATFTQSSAATATTHVLAFKESGGGGGGTTQQFLMLLGVGS